MSDQITTQPTPTTHVTIPIGSWEASIKAASSTVATDTVSSFHNHVRTWVLVILTVAIVAFIYIHERDVNAAANQQAADVVKQGAATQANIDKQISALHEDTKTQVQAIQQQIQQAQTVAQTIAL
jgi:apolipoprotein N-acyltransferase